MSKAYFISAIGTDLGKTFFVTQFCKKLREDNILVDAIKPIASGFGDDKNSDSYKILEFLGKKYNLENLNQITPWRFLEPSSPNFAAKKLGQEINFLEVRDFCLRKISQANKENKLLFIEGAGGLMTPINSTKTFFDLIISLNIPTLFLTMNYLGSISHTLSCLELMKIKNVFVEKVIINEFKNQDFQDSLASNHDFKEVIENFSGNESVFMENFLKKPLDYLPF